MTVEDIAEVIDHPEDALARTALAEMIALYGVTHLLLREPALSHDLLTEVGVVGVSQEWGAYGGLDGGGENVFESHLLLN